MPTGHRLQTIHSVHDAEGNRLAEYDYDLAINTTTLLREYVWLEGVPVAMVDGATDAVYWIDNSGVNVSDGVNVEPWT